MIQSKKFDCNLCLSGVMRRDSKTGDQKDMYLKEIRLHAQSLLSVLRSIVNILWEGGFWGWGEEAGVLFDHLRQSPLYYLSYEQCPGRFLGIIGQNTSAPKSYWYVFDRLKYVPQIPLNYQLLSWSFELQLNIFLKLNQFICNYCSSQRKWLQPPIWIC